MKGKSREATHNEMKTTRVEFNRKTQSKRSKKSLLVLLAPVQRDLAAAVAAALAFAATIAHAAEPLLSWNDSAAKKSSIAFVEKVAKEGSPDFVPPAERIATFDNDGTLWAEQPMLEILLFRAVAALDVQLSQGTGE